MAERRNARGLAFRDWPAADRRMWEGLIRDGDVFDGSGPFARARLATLDAWRNAYGFFLGHLVRIGASLETEDPAERATLDRLRSYAKSIDGLAPRTQAGYFAGLFAVLSAAFPTRDWSRLKAAKRNLHRRAEWAGGIRSKAREMTGNVLLELGLTMISEARDASDPLDLKTAGLWRDGMLIAFLAAHPIRIFNFALLEIGETFRPVQSGFRVLVPADASKNHRPFDFTVAPQIAAQLDGYLRDCRPVFPRGASCASGRLWLAPHGDPWSHKSIGRRISAHTQARLGIRVTPQRFRHAAATTLAVTEGSDPRLAKALLTHATPNLAERVYNQATQLDASTRYVRVLDGLRREARHQLGRRRCAQ